MHRRFIYILSWALCLPRGIEYREMGMREGEAEVVKEIEGKSERRKTKIIEEKMRERGRWK